MGVRGYESTRASINEWKVGGMVVTFNTPPTSPRTTQLSQIHSILHIGLQGEDGFDMGESSLLLLVGRGGCATAEGHFVGEGASGGEGEGEGGFGDKG